MHTGSLVFILVGHVCRVVYNLGNGDDILLLDSSNIGDISFLRGGSGTGALSSGTDFFGCGSLRADFLTGAERSSSGRSLEDNWKFWGAAVNRRDCSSFI